MKKRTEEQKMKRAENIETAFYAVKRALMAEELSRCVPYYRNNNEKDVTKRPEFQALCDALTDRAVEMMLEAFEGEVHGKKVRKPRRAP
jgi:hypothetical protein